MMGYTILFNYKYMLFNNYLSYDIGIYQLLIYGEPGSQNL